MLDSLNEKFRLFAHRSSEITGSFWSFALALLVVAVWGITGPLFGYSDTWQLVINTGTTIVTFLMVFLIQNTQNRDTRAIHLKLDELIKSTEKARASMMDVEDLSDKELEKLRDQFIRTTGERKPGRKQKSQRRQAN